MSKTTLFVYHVEDGIVQIKLGALPAEEVTKVLEQSNVEHARVSNSIFAYRGAMQALKACDKFNVEV